MYLSTDKKVFSAVETKLLSEFILELNHFGNPYTKLKLA
jgi:hypothetical protein